MKYIKITVLLLFTSFGFMGSAQKPKTDDEVKYVNVLKERSQKIVDEFLQIKDSDKEIEVRDLIVGQYWDLNQIHDKRDTQLKEAKDKLSDDQYKIKKKKIELKTEKTISKLHTSYLKNLSKYLSSEEVDQVKNGMTYNVYQITYKGYLDMLLDLTESQKEMISELLLEAREIAMDKGSSKEKHAVFGKYKGRINNILSDEGYDLNKESKDWHERLKSKE
ncbi:MAG TPA: DUF3826 domain-containing protein [Marinilabiliaceae bacterium]|nr:DUF3826 domain-containing protein [Marinilabiliaceae bacterium]